MYDIAIIGGGIHGCGIARDAAGRGLSVLLAEKADLASGTSSASSKLIHGGLRYLEHYNFHLVREALRERETLLAMAPHIACPLRFVLPHHRGLRPAWLMRLALLLYDRLGGRSRVLPASTAVDLTRDPVGKPLKAGFMRGFTYYDCRVDDARLVVLNAMDAAARGADIRVRTEVQAAHRAGSGWRIDLRDAVSGLCETVEARALVNASGAWVAATGGRIKAHPAGSIRLVKGSHIVVPRLYDHDSAYVLQNPDRRVVFAIPYEADFTLIGTTDVDCNGNLDHVAISPEEVAYLCEAANRYFSRDIAPSDVIWSYAGVRALHDDGQASAQETTRDFVLELDGAASGEAPLLSIVGGKLTTYRRVTEEVLARLVPLLAVQGRPGLDPRQPAAGRGFRLWGARAPGARAGGRGAIPRPGHGGAADPELRHNGAAHAGGCQMPRGPRRPFRRRSLRARGVAPARPRMGQDGRRHPVAAHEAGAATGAG